MQRSELCRSRRELSNEYLLAKIGVDTAENEPCKVCPLSVYRSPRSPLGDLLFASIMAPLVAESGRWRLRAELLANRAALVMWSGVGCNLSAVTAGF